MSGRTVQFSNFATTYHDYYRFQSGSPDSTPSNLSVPSEQLTPRHSYAGSGVIQPTLVSGVEISDRTPRVHNSYPGPPSGSTTSSLSLEPHAPHYPQTSQSRTLPTLQLMAGEMGPSLNVHKVLRYNSTPSINYNLLISDESAIEASPELTDRVLAEAASIPPTSSFVISCVGLPWDIMITPKSKKHNAIVTVGDVLHKLYRQLRQGVEMTDEHYRSLPTENQAILKRAFDARCELLPEGEGRTREHEKGLKCVDYLNMNTRFLGFEYIGEMNGVVHWKLEVASPRQRSSTVVGVSASDTSW
jgi:hypothetical protein